MAVFDDTVQKIMKKDFHRCAEDPKVCARSCETSGITVTDHFREVTKMVQLGSGSKRNVRDYMLTRYACYLIAQNGDPKKAEIAFA